MLARNLTQGIREARTVGYLSGMWRDFGVTVAGLAGALTGLLFVAVSIKSEALAQSRSLSSRAAQTLVLFMTSAIIAILLVTPQPRLALGLELLTAGAVCGIALYIFDRRAGHDPQSRVAPLHRASFLDAIYGNGRFPDGFAGPAAGHCWRAHTSSSESRTPSRVARPISSPSRRAV